MTGDINISVDLESLVRYAIDQVFALFGKDSYTKAERDRLDRLVRLAAQRAATVMCVGMVRAIPITEIYQPTRLKAPDSGETTIEQLLNRGEDAVILAGPGRGKTTLLHWTFMTLLKDLHRTPVLITLRRSDAFDDLEEFLKDLKSPQRKKTKAKQKVALLVDGYDEINLKHRKRVSELLEEFRSLDVGNYYLTSRLYYDIIDLRAPHYCIQDFNRPDAIGYLSSFGNVYGINLQPEQLLEELKEHGFEDFARSPLLLALVCILKASSMPSLPKNTIGLIRRAIETLTFRWDEAKGIHRERTLPIDGEERVRCLMRIAYQTPLLASDEKVQHIVREHLKLTHYPDMDVGKLLVEIAQHYGLFVPASESCWTFVHQTIQDFLAARYWVESGRFSPDRVYKWNLRAAYAACLVPEATDSIVKALDADPGVFFVTECLYNNAALEPGTVASAIEAHFNKFSDTFSVDRRRKLLVAETEQDLFLFASDELLKAVYLRAASKREAEAVDLLRAYSLAEVTRRRGNLPPATYNQYRLIFETPDFHFRVRRRNQWQEFALEDLKGQEEKA